MSSKNCEESGFATNMEAIIYAFQLYLVVHKARRI